MTKNKLIVQAETLPYLTLFDLNRSWLDLKNQRTGIVEEASELRARMWALTHKINEIEENISKAIVRLEKKNA